MYKREKNDNSVRLKAFADSGVGVTLTDLNACELISKSLRLIAPHNLMFIFIKMNDNIYMKPQTWGTEMSVTDMIWSLRSGSGAARVQ